MVLIHYIIVMILSQFVLASGNLSPVILIPGDGGNQLEAKLDKPQDSTGCTTQRDWYRLWLDVWQLSGTKLKCWADNIKLVYNSSSHSSTNVPGVSTRVPGWGSTSSVEYLDPSWSAWVIGDAGNYMKDLVDFLVSLGYTRNVNIRAAPFDFRFAPHSQGNYFTQLKKLIEDTVAENSGTPVTIISHSMGGLFGLHFLQNQTPDWLAENIKRFVPLNTPWAGAVVQLNTYASGYNMGISVVDPLVIREEQRSYETGVYILPSPANWPNQEEVLVSTPTRNYTVRNYSSFFDDIGFPEGVSMLDDVVNITHLSPPGVDVACVYSVGVPTPTALVYQGNFPDTQPERIMGEGDGTVTSSSLELCNLITHQPSNSVGHSCDRSYDVTKSFENINHGGILKNPKVFGYIQTLLQN